MSQTGVAFSPGHVSLTAELSAFRQGRIDDLLAGRVIGPVSANRVAFIHVLPVGGIDGVVALAPHSDRLRTLLPPIGAASWDYRFNADGYLVHAGDWRGDGIPTYVQWLRCGGVEIFVGNLVREKGEGSPVTVPTLYSGILGEYLRTHVPLAVKALWELLGVKHALAVSAKLVGVKGVQFADSTDRWPSGLPIDRDVVTTPWIVMAPDTDPSSPMATLGDVLWQSAGMSGMPPTTAR